ncbi:MAG: undecaprenyl/decaprenyl-phosphate alpha-N-acetylglucosaminyl 1-phosphate transferase [Alphaproteobacteria bacterium]|nr:undecaprenyl/decaprenyl-phosphate alpha-N-acetylglucosaminyl 1-phosphate transferase [Alphaproteobacteria bacterium]
MKNDFILSAFWTVGPAFLLVMALMPVFRALAPALGLMDRPDARKNHEGAVPLIGGLVILPVFILVSVVGGAGFLENWPLYSAVLLLLLTGAMDDKIHLHPFIKFGMQFIAAALVVMPGGAQIHDLGNLFGFGVFALGWASLPFSIVAVVLLINAVNLMDGLDGLAGGVVFIILGWFLAACIMSGAGGAYAHSLSILMAGIAGFLFYNMRTPWRSKASIFMGDAGSMSLGLLLGWYAIALSSPEQRILEPMAVAWVMAVPIWDECAQFYRRVCEGHHPFWPDLGHFHHHFIRAGFSPGLASALIHLIVLIMGGIGVMGTAAGVPLFLLSSLWIAGILAHMAYSKNIENYTGLLSRVRRLCALGA